MQGRAVVTNTDGIADFRDMYFEQAHPGGEYWRGLAHFSSSCVCCSPVRNSHSFRGIFTTTHESSLYHILPV
jgi:hypothetical protein